MKKILQSLKSNISCYLNLPCLYGKLSYSQEGEDIILEKLFKDMKNGFYLDIGAFHPFKYSNTQKLYQKGWHGINIEPNNNNWKLFNIARKRDINLNVGIGSKDTTQTYYTFEDPALNTFNHKNYKAVINSDQSRFLRSYKQEIKSLYYIKRKYLKTNNIDLINIDTEGYSNVILRSIIKLRMHPKIICIERGDMGENINMSNNIIRIMSNNMFHIIGATSMSYIFISDHFSKMISSSRLPSS